jgi:hypothetical protein
MIKDENGINMTDIDYWRRKAPLPRINNLFNLIVNQEPKMVFAIERQLTKICEEILPETMTELYRDNADI